MRSRQFRRKRGVTLVEVMIAATLTSITLIAGVACLLTTAQSWARGQGAIDSENGTHGAIRRMVAELREAMNISINADGSQITYQKPKVSPTTGEYEMPVVSDGITRRFRVVSGILYADVGSTARVLCKNIRSTDPHSGSSYRVFTAPTASVQRQVTIQLVAENYGFRTEMRWSRGRETVFLRNVPQLTR